MQCGNTAPTRNRAKETSGSADLGPATCCAVGEDLETTSVTGTGPSSWIGPFYGRRGRTQTLPCRTTRGDGRLWIQTWILTVTFHWLHKVWPTLAITLQSHFWKMCMLAAFWGKSWEPHFPRSTGFTKFGRPNVGLLNVHAIMLYWHMSTGHEFKYRFLQVKTTFHCHLKTVH